MRRTFSLELIAKNPITKRLSFRSLHDVRRFRASASTTSQRSLKFERPVRYFNYKVKLKILAVHMAIKKLMNRILFIEDLERNKLGKFIHVQCPEQILSWKYEDWLDTESHRLLWFKVIDRQMSPRQFTIWMKLKNYTAIRNCLYDLGDCYVNKNEFIMPMDVMASIVKFHNFEAEISKQVQKNEAKADRVRLQLVALVFIKRTMGSLTKKPEDLFLISNIENNYVLRFHKVREEQAEMRLQIAEKRLKKEIQKAKKRFYEEQFATTCTTDTYFNQIENLRQRIAKLTLHYDSEYSRLDGNITYLKTAIEKMQANRSYLEEQMAWFKESLRLFDEGINPPKLSITPKPLKNLHFHKERRLTLLRPQRSLMSINSQTRWSLRPRTRPKKETSFLIGTENLE
ncbi:uncharacterized protein LOC105225704 [Bactrocera dorsalis]|uniref:Uncharacterized protein LOC105225704 n=1 Tax=Bactrocera dorsalis TaxID=27457 RepID=A0A6I9V3S3_BACDO|nr:uncharacterized protein LOC105225704 [Bactrocera dorsalis]